jgi:CheY-like chemotaxis protein
MCTLKFLLIDDDEDDRSLFCEALQEIDSAIVCYTASSGRAAIDQLVSGKMDLPHIIFLDLNMPKLNGWQCLSLLQEHEAYKSIPVILYSTSSLWDDRHKAEGARALCYYTKPSDYKDLKQDLLLVIYHLLNHNLSSLIHQAPFFTAGPLSESVAEKHE